MYHLFPALCRNSQLLLVRRHECVNKVAKHKKHLICEHLKKHSLSSLRGKCRRRRDISLLRREIFGIYESAITHGKYGNIGDHFPSSLFAVKPELVRELTRARNPGAVNLRFRDSHATPVTVSRKSYPSFSTY